MRKIISYSIAFALISSIFWGNLLCTNAAESEMLQIEVDGLVFTSAEYTKDEYSYVKRYDGENILVDILNTKNECIETLTIYPEETIQDKTRASGTYVQRPYSHQKSAKVGIVTVCKVENDLVLKIFSSGSFTQIEDVISNTVHKADGFSSMQIVGTPVASAISPTGSFPTTSVDCYYSATCEGSFDVGLNLGMSAELGIKKLKDAGFNVTGNVGTTIYYTKNVSSSWNVSVM